MVPTHITQEPTITIDLASELPAGDVTRARANAAALTVLHHLPAEATHTDLSPTQLDALRGWSGWGPMAKVLDPRITDEPWASIYSQIEPYFLAHPGTEDAASAATPTAFYTPRWVMDLAWRIIRDYGTPAGPVLEPGCGSGRFAACAPDGYSVTGIELDPTSARIARLLNPTMTVIEGRFERQALPGGFVAAIGNVPYSEAKILDRSLVNEKLAVHNYFLLKALASVMSGGLVVALTSRYTLDAYDEGNTARGHLARYGDLIGAIRLPTSGMADAGTDVVADLIVLRKRRTTDRDDLNDWVNGSRYGSRYHGEGVALRDDLVPGTRMVVHRTFADPDLVLGSLDATSGRYGGMDLIVRNTGDLADRIPRAEKAIARALRGATPPPAPVEVPPSLAGQGDLNEGSYQRIEGVIYRVEAGGQLEPIPAQKGKGARELHDLITLRDMVLALLDADADPANSDADVAGVRTITRALYNAYVNRWGFLNRATIAEGKVDPETGIQTIARRRPRMGGFSTDPHYVTVLAIETYDDDTGIGQPGPILLRRINRPEQQVHHVDSIADAVAVCMDQHGALTVEHLAELLDTNDLRAVRAEMAGTGVAFVDPDTDTWVPSDEYLSGDVRAKLKAAKHALRRDPSFRRNVDALEPIQPIDLLPSEIKVRPGAAWVPVSDVEQFIADTFKVSSREVEVEHEPRIAAWSVKVPGHLRDLAAASTTWGTSRIDGFRLIELALNNSQPLIQDPTFEKKKVKNEEETLLAIEKQRELIERFTDWVWEDDERRVRLARVYNDRYNAVVPRVYDGSTLTFPGMVDGFDPYPSQRQMVHRALSMEMSLCGHVVGGGKTAIMAMTAIKMRRLGHANKPVAIVPNHLLEQTAREVKALFPTARVLLASRGADAAERRSFAAKVATGDWDLVVMSHSMFTAIPVSKATEAAWIDEQLVDYRVALLDEGDDGNTSGRTFKAIQTAARKLETRLEDLLEKRVDTGVTWEQLGVDYLMVDEAHYFKNLAVPTRMQGFSIAGSKRASDLEMKLWALRHHGQKRIGMLLTGTAVSNSLAEMYVLLRYCAPARLRELGLNLFDAWAAQHVEFETKVEVAPDGGSFRVHTRPSRFCNVAELLTEFREVADIRTKADLNLPGPAIADDNVIIPPSDELRAYVAELVERSDRIRRRQVEPSEDNMLLVCTDGRKAALDLELVGIYSQDKGKAPVVAERILATWRETQHLVYDDVHGNTAERTGAMQVVFCDLGTPKPGDAQVYGKIRRRLIAGGMPAESIRFIHEARTDTAKAALFADCRSGRVAVLFGSTDKLGVGTNVQKRLIHLHHVDAPWRPADVEQRNGRGDRPGNENETLLITRYVREGSFDSYMWQALERKARFIGQVLGGDRTIREVDDLGEVTLTYTEVKALATGNPLLMEHTEAVADVSRLQRLARAHEMNHERLTRAAHHAEERAARLDQGGTWWASLAKVVTDTGIEDVEGFDPADFADDYDDPTLGNRNVAGHAIAARIRRMIGYTIDWPKAEAAFLLGRACGVSLDVDYRHWGGWPRIKLIASHDGRRVSVVEIDVAWFKSGHYWRIEDAITTALRNAEAHADEMFLDATKRRQEADAALEERGVFPQQLDLDEALERKARIEEAMRKQAAETSRAAAVTAAK